MTDLQNAEKLRYEFLTRSARKNTINICNARPNWNGCDYCDVYAGPGLECWKQNAKHTCVHVTEEKRK